MKISLIIAFALMVFALFYARGKTASVENSASRSAVNKIVEANSPGSLAGAENGAVGTNDASRVGAKNQQHQLSWMNSALRDRDLKRTATLAADSSTVSGANAALEIVGQCLMYLDNRSASNDLTLADAFLDKGTANLLRAGGHAPNANQRAAAVREMSERCSGFDGISFSAISRKAVATIVASGGMVSWREVDARALTPAQTESIRQYMQNPDDYVSAIWRGRNVLVGVVADNIGAEQDLSKAGLVFRMAMCQLGAECGAKSLESLQICISLAICESSVQQSSELLAAALGHSAEDIRRHADSVAGAIRRSDMSYFFKTPSKSQ